MSMPADMIFWILMTLLVTGSAVFLVKKANRKRRDDLLTTFSKLGSRNNLSFSGQELLPGSLLGFDGLKKKLLVLEYMPHRYRWYTIDLEEVKSCSVQKTYRLPGPAVTAPRTVGEYVDRIELQFHFRNRERSRSIPFYRAGFNGVEELPALEAKARGWNCFLTKLLPARQNGRA